MRRLFHALIVAVLCLFICVVLYDSWTYYASYTTRRAHKEWAVRRREAALADIAHLKELANLAYDRSAEYWQRMTARGLVCEIVIFSGETAPPPYSDRRWDRIYASVKNEQSELNFDEQQQLWVITTNGLE